VAARVVVLASGAGTLLQALLDASASKALAADIVAVGTNLDGIPALSRAAQAGVPTFVCRPADYADRPAWDAALLEVLRSWQPELLVIAGFMRILGPEIVAEFAGRIVNTHPSLLPAFPGAHAVRDAMTYGVKVTGCTVHIIDGGVDTGRPILAQRAVEILPEDDETTLHERIKVIERELLVAAVTELIDERRDS